MVDARGRRRSRARPPCSATPRPKPVMLRTATMISRPDRVRRRHVESARALARAVCLASLAVAAARAAREPAPPAPIRFLHTFGAEETELFNATMAERGLAVESSLVPFARGQQVIGEILRAGTDCPDLIRIDATWLPGLVAADLLRAGARRARAARLDARGGRARASSPARWRRCRRPSTACVVCATVASPAPATPTIDDLRRRRARRAHAGRPAPARRPRRRLLVRAVAARRGWRPRASARSTATARSARWPRFAALFGDVAPPPPPVGQRGARRAAPLDRRTRSRTGSPGRGSSARSRDRDRARGRRRSPARRAAASCSSCRACAKRPERGLAARGRADRRRGRSAVRRGVRDGADARGRARRRAAARRARSTTRCAAPRCCRARRVTPLLFDDLNPALAAVVAATRRADEAIDGVRRGWRRLPAAATATP